MAWWKRVIKGQPSEQDNRTQPSSPAEEPELDDLYVSTAFHSLQRVEDAMPGTASITPILALVPPPIDPSLGLSYGPEPDQDYGPDPIAQYALAAPARGVFSVGQLGAAITQELRDYFALPTFYVRTRDNRVTYMVSSEAPQQAIEIITAWDLREAGADETGKIYAGAQGLAAWLATRPEGFATAEPSLTAIAAQHEAAQRIVAIRPKDAVIAAWPKAPNPSFDGKKLWRVLHALGLRWGDMDQFQWRDPTGQTDYLFWAEVDDGQFGYAVPEEIAAGRQNFKSVLFAFDIARTPQPVHVLSQMVRAAEAFSKELDCHLSAAVDGTQVDSPAELELAVGDVVTQLQGLGLKPGSRAVCILR